MFHQRVGSLKQKFVKIKTYTTERDGRFVCAPEEPPVAGPPRTSFDTIGGAAWVVAEVAVVPPAGVSPEPGSPLTR